jgi:hypothetical protein
MKISRKSAKYEIIEHRDTKSGELIYLGLYSVKQNCEVKTCHGWEVAYFFQYNITIPQMNYLNHIEKIWSRKHITVIRNRFGHLHVFKGIQEGKLTNSGSNVLVNQYDGTHESDLYLQVDTDIEGLKESMTKRQREDLDAGYEVVMEDIGYF